MQKLLNFLLFLVILLLFPFRVYAEGDFEPFVQINNSYAALNPIPQGKAVSFVMVQQVAPDNYLVLKELNFKVDTFKLNKPVDWIQKASFSWDFGDGSERKEGIQAKHVYQKPGSYFVTLFGKTEGGEDQELAKVSLNILPMQNYKLPSAKIELDGVNHPENKVTLPFSLEFSFDGSTSIPGSAEITEYFWDFGDGQTSSEKKVTHKFDSHHYNSFVILRIKDSNGFISDAYLEVVNQENTKTLDEALNTTNPSSKYLPWFIVLGVGMLILLGIFVLRKFPLKIRR